LIATHEAGEKRAARGQVHGLNKTEDLWYAETDKLRLTGHGMN